MSTSTTPTKRPRGRMHYEAQRILADLVVKFGLVTTLEQVAEASKWQAKLRNTEADVHKIRAWEAFLHQDKVDKLRVKAEILIYRATGQSSSFFIPEQASSNILDGDAVQELNSCVVGTIRLIIEDRLGDLDPDLPEFRARQKSPAQCLKTYMVAYKARKQFQLWNYKWTMDLNRKILSVVHSDRPKKFINFSAPQLQTAFKAQVETTDDSGDLSEGDQQEEFQSQPQLKHEDDTNIFDREETPEPDFRHDFTLSRTGDLYVPPYTEGDSNLRRLIHEGLLRVRGLRMDIYKKQDALEAARRICWGARKMQLQLAVSPETLQKFQDIMTETGAFIDETKRGTESLSEVAQETLMSIDGFTKDEADAIVEFLEPKVKEVIAEKGLRDAETAWERRRDRRS